MKLMGMLWTTICWGLLLALSWMPTLGAQSTPPTSKPAKTAPADNTQDQAPAKTVDPKLKKQVEALIVNLDSDSFETREAASHELVTLGPKIADILESKLDGVALETRLRLRAIIAEFRAKAPEKEVVEKLAASLVSLEFVDTKLADACRELSELMSFQIVPHSSIAPGILITYRCQDKPLLEVLDEFADLAEVNWSSAPHQRRINLYNRNNKVKSIRRYYGPLRLSLTSFVKNTTMDFGGEARHNCYIRAQFDIEPGSPIIGVWMQPQIIDVIDDQKKSLVRDAVKEDDRIGYFNAAHSRLSFAFNLNINAPSPKATQLSLIAGRIHIAVATKYVELDLPFEKGASDLTDRNQNELPKLADWDGLFHGRIKDIRKQRANLAVTLETIRDIPEASGTRTTPIQDHFFEATTKNGARVTGTRGATRYDKRSKRETVTITFKDGEYETLHIRATSAFRRETIEYKFADLPLPKDD